MFPLANRFLIPEHGTCFCSFFSQFPLSCYIPSACIVSFPRISFTKTVIPILPIYQQKPRNITAMEPLLSLAPILSRIHIPLSLPYYLTLALSYS